MTRKKTTVADTTQRYDNPPKTLDDHPFYGLKLDDDQRNYRDGIYSSDYDIVFCDSPSGNGKTFLAVATALLMCEYGMYDSIVYMSAAGVHEHKSGYLPGTIAEKAAPLTQPLYQAVAKLGYNPEQTVVSDSNMYARKEGRALITTMTDNYIRGINIGSDDNRVIYIIDEAQNFTVDGLRTALTRVNEGSKTIVIGHHAQCDLKYTQDSGFVPYLNHFATEPWCKVCKLTKNYRGRVSAHADKL